ncbi:MAG: ABC transporter substrate-binding protein, partial [Chloroflexota bacterium]
RACRASPGTEIAADPPNWSVFTAATYTVQMNGHAYDKLVDVATGPGNDPLSANLIPGLAQAMPETPDPSTYVFKIRQGVKFQNVAPVNGRPLTVEDVKYSIDQIRNSNTFKADYAAVSDVTTPDANTLIVKTKTPYAPLLNFSAGHYGWRIFPKEIIDSKITDTNAIGTGPFIRSEYAQGNRAVFKKNPDYWDKDSISIDEMQVLVMPDTTAMAAAFRTKQIDITPTGLSPIQVEDLQKQVKDATIQKSLGNVPWIAFNTTKPPFNDVRVRQAISLLYNRDAERKAVFNGESDSTALLPFPEALKPKDIPDMQNFRKLDVAEAKKLLAAAGFANGFKTPIIWTNQYSQTAGYTDSLDRIVGDLKAGGIDATPQSVEYGQWIASIYRPPFNFEGILWGPGRYYSDPDPYVSYWLHPKGIANQSRVNDPAMTALLEKQAIQINPKERWDTLREIQKLEAKNMYYVWRDVGTTSVFVNKNVHDFARHDGYDMRELWKVWLDA